MQNVILLDMDGVLVDWVGGVCRLYGLDQEELESNWGEDWGICSAVGVSEEELWEGIDAEGPAFWYDLEALPWAEALFAECSSRAPTYILSSPSRSPHSAAGKVEWMHRHLGYPFRDFLLGPCKELCARLGSILIDDRPRNVERFRANGGDAILFPRPWNDNRDSSDEALSFTLSALDNMLRSRPDARLTELRCRVCGRPSVGPFCEDHATVPR